MIEHMVEHRGRGRCQPDADGSKHKRAQGRPTGHGQEHTDNSREHDQHDDTRLGQLVEVTPVDERLDIRTHSHGGISQYAIAATDV